MKYIIHARPGKKVAKVELMGQNELRVDIDAPAVDGKANARLIEILAEYLNLPKSSLIIKIGSKNKLKILETN